jgi:hypothetical protein
MGRFCAALEGWRYSYKILFIEPEGKKRLGQYCVAGRIIILIVVFPCIFDKYKLFLPTNALFIKT